jgi:hypothetical protein
MAAHKIRVILDPQTGENPWSFLVRRSPDKPVESVKVTYIDETTGIQYGPVIAWPVDVEPTPTPEPEPEPEPTPEPEPEPEPGTTAHTISLVAQPRVAGGNDYSIDATLRDDAGAGVAGVVVTLTVTGGTFGPGTTVETRTTDAAGLVRINWEGAADGDSLTASAPDAEPVEYVHTTTVIVPPVVDPLPPPPPPNGADLTPANLRLLLGPMVARGTNPPGWPTTFDSRLDVAIARMVSEVAAGGFSEVIDGGDQDNAHYGPLRLVAMRNIRAGLPLDESEPGFAAAMTVTRDTIRKYAIPNLSTFSQYNRYSNWADCELVVLLYRGESSDNGKLADECLRHLHIAAVWGSGFITAATKSLEHQWMDTRTAAMVMDVAMCCDRLGIAYGTVPANYSRSQWNKPAGVSSWGEWVLYLGQWIADVQAESDRRFAGQTDAAGNAVLPGGTRWKGNSATAQQTTPPEPWALALFSSAMLADALLRADREYGCVQCRQVAIALAPVVQQQYDPQRQALPYLTAPAPAGGRFTGTNQDYDLNNFWVGPLLIMHGLTGEAWMRDIAIGLMANSRLGAWEWRFKQAQQLGSATFPQTGEAILAGLSWR